MAEKCPECGEGQLVNDVFELQVQTVCQECGYVKESGSWGESADFQATRVDNAASFASTSALPYSYVRKQLNNKVPKGKSLGVKRAKEIGYHIGLSEVMIQDAISLFTRAFDHHVFHSLLIEKKIVLSGCCIYVICRQNNWPVSLSYFCDLLQCEIYYFGRLKNKLISNFNIEITSVDLSEIVPHLCGKANLNELVNDSMKLIQLCREAWLSTGRRSEPVVISAMFMIWKSQDYISRKDDTLKQFCQMHKLDFSANTYHIRLKEMSQLILCLCEKIPWIPTKMKPKHVSLYIKDVLQFQNTLTKEYAKKCSQVEDHEADSESNQQTHSSSESESTTTKRKANVLLPVSFDQPKKRKAKSTTGSISPEIEYSGNLDSLELTEVDIPDSQMNQYIRTDEEIKQWIKIKSNIEEGLGTDEKS